MSQVSPSRPLALAEGRAGGEAAVAARERSEPVPQQGAERPARESAGWGEAPLEVLRVSEVDK